MRKLWRRLTGRAEREAAQRARETTEASLRQAHHRELQEVRLAALDEGVYVYRQNEPVEVTNFDDPQPRYLPIGHPVWWSYRLDVEEAERMRNAIITSL